MTIGRRHFLKLSALSPLAARSAAREAVNHFGGKIAIPSNLGQSETMPSIGSAPSTPANFQLFQERSVAIQNRNRIRGYNLGFDLDISSFHSWSTAGKVLAQTIRNERDETLLEKLRKELLE